MRKWELVDDALCIIDHLTDVALTMDTLVELEYLVEALQDTCEFLNKDKMYKKLKKRRESYSKKINWSVARYHAANVYRGSITREQARVKIKKIPYFVTMIQQCSKKELRKMYRRYKESL